ncbi:nuclease-related domain-containing protein [Staphylococcus piscifermentans]|uniref:nuclease-related domain-containing protein n=1 Tax=Staphylococcus piscifermentans TaxID=70258 RepID=UPI001E32A6A8|nr:nuclease-related domain-containing protein [Staphylococcus piscifermentans]
MEGERFFDNFLQSLPSCQYLKRIEFGEFSFVEFDFIVFTCEALCIFEVKHYRGPYLLEEGSLVHQHNKKIIHKNPFNQLNRAQLLLQSMLQEIGVKLPVISALIFTHPEFTLLNPLALKKQGTVLLRSELNQLKQTVKAGCFKRNIHIMNELVKKSSPCKNKYIKVERLPFDTMKSGLRCPKCQKLTFEPPLARKRLWRCPHCEHELKQVDLIQCNLVELFICKGEPFSLSEAMKWCNCEKGNNNQHKMLYRILMTTFKHVGITKDRRYYLEMELW